MIDTIITLCVIFRNREFRTATLAITRIISPFQLEDKTRMKLLLVVSAVTVIFSALYLDLLVKPTPSTNLDILFYTAGNMFGSFAVGVLIERTRKRGSTTNIEGTP